jgi:hypothetical protein
MTARWITALVMSAALVAGCQRQADKMVEFSGHIFVFNYRVAAATYVVTLNKTAPIPEGAVAIADFENPMGGDPLVTKEKIYSFWTKITLESPDVYCIRKDKPYTVNIRLVDADGKTLQSLKTTVTSNLDQTILPSKPLVVGPDYTKNPEVFKADGSVDYGTTACPAS